MYIAKSKNTFLVFLPVCVLLGWRVADIADELLTGAIKMSVGQWVLEGYEAMVMQLVIIGLLLVFLIKTWRTVFCADA